MYMMVPVPTDPGWPLFLLLLYSLPAKRQGDGDLVPILTLVCRLVASLRTLDPASIQSPSVATQSPPFLFPASVAAALVLTKTTSNLRKSFRYSVATCVIPS